MGRFGLETLDNLRGDANQHKDYRHDGTECNQNFRVGLPEDEQESQLQ